MIPVTHFSLAPTQLGSPSPTTRRVLFEGHPLATELAGSLLEAQYRCHTGYLLLLTDDSPYEEVLHVYLISRELRLLEQVDVGAPYAPGVLGHLQVVSENELAFSFPVATRWHIRVESQPRRLSTPLGVSRPHCHLLSKCYLDIFS